MGCSDGKYFGTIHYMKILIINGSHRAGNTDAITDVFIQETEKKHEVKEIKLREKEMKLPDGCELCAKSEYCPNIKDEFSISVEPDIRNFDVYIIATPTYSDNVTPLIKIFWDRIIPWCHEERMYLKGKKVGVITHGMDESSLNHVVDWVRGVCGWEEAEFIGSFLCKSGSSAGSVNVDKEKLAKFVSVIG